MDPASIAHVVHCPPHTRCLGWSLCLSHISIFDETICAPCPLPGLTSRLFQVEITFPVLSHPLGPCYFTWGLQFRAHRQWNHIKRYMQNETESRSRNVFRNLDFPCGPGVKNLSASAGDSISNPGLGRFAGEGNGNPLQYSCPDNPMDRGAWWATVHGIKRVGHDQVSKHELRNLTLPKYPDGYQWPHPFKQGKCLQ